MHLWPASELAPIRWTVSSRRWLQPDFRFRAIRLAAEDTKI